MPRRLQTNVNGITRNALIAKRNVPHGREQPLVTVTGVFAERLIVTRGLIAKLGLVQVLYAKQPDVKGQFVSIPVFGIPVAGAGTVPAGFGVMIVPIRKKAVPPGQIMWFVKPIVAEVAPMGLVAIANR